jgi:hypothetical protein
MGKIPKASHQHENSTITPISNAPSGSGSFKSGLAVSYRMGLGGGSGLASSVTVDRDQVRVEDVSTDSVSAISSSTSD